MALTSRFASWTVSLTRNSTPNVGQHGPIVTELRCAAGWSAGRGRPLSRSSPRARASWRRNRWFSSASSRLRRLAISRRCCRESLLARCWVGIGVLGWGRRWSRSRRISSVRSVWGIASRLLRTAGSHQQRWPGPRPELDIADAVGARGRAGVAATVAVLLSPSRASAKLVLPVTVAAPVVGRTPGRCRPRTQPSAPSRAA